MSTATIAPAPLRSDPANLTELRRLQRDMLRLTSAASSKEDLLRALIELIDRLVPIRAAYYLGRDDKNRFQDPLPLVAIPGGSLNQRLAKHMTSSCMAACGVGVMEIRPLSSPACLLTAAPVPLPGRDPDAVSIIFAVDQPRDVAALIVQMFTTYVVLWGVIGVGREHQGEARQAAAMVELVDHILSARDQQTAAFNLVAELQAYLGCDRVALALCHGKSARCRLLAISGVSKFDKRSAVAEALEAAGDEAILRDGLAQWPAPEEDRHAALAHKQLAALEEVESVIGVPLRNPDGDPVGALLVLSEHPPAVSDQVRFLKAAEPSLAIALEAARRLDGGPLTRIHRWLRELPAWKNYLAGGVAIAFAAAMLIPLPHQLRCACQIEPTTRRFVAAPFDGSLEKAFVKPGDLVEEGQLLARLDGRELRWNRATVQADQNRAMKQRDAAQAAHNFSEQQIARLEIERLGLELEVLDHRTKNLEVTSPITGVVASGDLERTEGAPLTTGQALFEIAPLETMIVETAVADSEMAYLQEGASIEIRLDAYPGETWTAVASKIQPRAEIRDEENVFIVEAQLDNHDGRLRPGMKGRARIAAGVRPLGWIVFHKPWEFLTKTLSW